MFEVYEKYGELARVGPSILLTCDLDLLQWMNSARSNYTRSDCHSGQKLEADHDNLFSALDEKVHMKWRAQMAAEVSLPFSIFFPSKNMLRVRGLADCNLLDGLCNWGSTQAG